MLQIADRAPRAPAALAAALIELRADIDRLELRFSQLAASFDKTRYWDLEGFNSAIDWLRFNCRMTSTAASDRVAVGHRLGDLAESARAMRAKAIGFAHLIIMARTAGAIRGDFDETRLLPLAKAQTPGKFHYRCMHHRHASDADGYAAEQAEMVENRRLKLSTAQDGCLLISGILDPVGGAVVRTALEPLAKPSGTRDGRKSEQRQADALVEFASKPGKQHVAMQVTAPLETLLGLVGAPGAENEFTLPISSKTVARWACDCSLTRVLLQDSVVIDIGRAERTIKGPRRRALIARDRHCQWPGCERPAAMCEGHHLEPWIYGGSGEIENQILLCTRHHWKVHEGGWQLVKTGDGRAATIAPAVPFGPAHRRPGIRDRALDERPPPAGRARISSSPGATVAPSRLMHQEVVEASTRRRRGVERAGRPERLTRPPASKLPLT